MSELEQITFDGRVETVPDTQPPSYQTLTGPQAQSVRLFEPQMEGQLDMLGDNE